MLYLGFKATDISKFSLIFVKIIEIKHMLQKYLGFVLSFVLSLSLSAQFTPYNHSNSSVSDTAGVLYDNGGPNANYSADQNLTFTINTSNGKPINLQFNKLDIESSGFGISQVCIYDYLEIYDGADATAPLIGTYCGTDEPQGISSTGNSLTFVFVSDGATEQAGYEILWSTGTEFPEPNTPDDSRNDYCKVTIANAPPGCGESSWITSTTIGDMVNNNGTCDRDELLPPNFAADDGVSDYSDIIVRFDANTPSTVGVALNSLITENVTVFVDWDNSGTWDPLETLPLIGNSYAGLDFTGILIPPINAVTGQVIEGGLMIVSSFLFPYLQPCNDPLSGNQVTYGEVELYSFYVHDPELITCTNVIYPTNNDTDVCLNSEFVWNTKDSAIAYEVLLTDFGNGDTIELFQTNDTTFISKNIDENKEYIWKVTPIQSDGRKAIDCTKHKFTTVEFGTAEIDFSENPFKICNNTVKNLNTDVVSGAGLNFLWSGIPNMYFSDINAESPDLSIDYEFDGYLYLNVEDEYGCKTNDSIEINTIDFKPGYSLDLDKSFVCDEEEFQFILSQEADNLTFLKSSASNPNFTNAVPLKIENDTVFTFNKEAEDFIYKFVLSEDICSDTFLIDTISFIDPLTKPEVKLINPVPTVGPCEGTNYQVIVTNLDSNITWHNGIEDTVITINKSTNCTAVFEQDGCKSTTHFDAVLFSNPPIPNIKFTQDPNDLCVGDTIFAYHDYKLGAFEWTTLNSDDDTIKLFFNVDLGITVFSQKNCKSVSDIQEIRFKQFPPKPKISTETGTVGRSLCELDEVVLVNKDDFDKQWSTGETSDRITISESGTYTLKVYNGRCVSESDPASFVFNPKPDRPVISRISSSPFDSLKASVDAFYYQWYKDDVLLAPFGQTIAMKEAGAYQVEAVSEFECVSERSEAFVSVSVSELDEVGLKVLNKEQFNLVTSEAKISEAILYTLDGRIISKYSNVSEIEVEKNQIKILKLIINGKVYRVKLN